MPRRHHSFETSTKADGHRHAHHAEHVRHGPCAAHLLAHGAGLVSDTSLPSTGVQDTLSALCPRQSYDQRPPVIDTAIIPCGGLGTRLAPITRWIAKEMLPVGLKPVLYWTLDEAAEAGLTRAIIITNPLKPMLEAAARQYQGALELEFVPQDAPADWATRSSAPDHLAGARSPRLLPDNLFHRTQPVNRGAGNLRSAPARPPCSWPRSVAGAGCQGRHRQGRGSSAPPTARSGSSRWRTRAGAASTPPGPHRRHPDWPLAFPVTSSPSSTK